MAAPERAAAASGTVLGLLTGAYERRDRIALVTFGGDGAQVVLTPTSSVEVARNRLGELRTGGPTPLAAGLEEVAAGVPDLLEIHPFDAESRGIREGDLVALCASVRKLRSRGWSYDNASRSISVAAATRSACVTPAATRPTICIYRVSPRVCAPAAGSSRVRSSPMSAAPAGPPA